MRAALLALIALAGCKPRDMVQLRYALEGIPPEQVVRVETIVGVDPKDGRAFFADQPFRQVAKGVGYEVLVVDGSGARAMLVSHDATLGFQFQPHFTFTLLPPDGGPAPALVIRARAVGTSRNTLGETAPLEAAFGSGAAVEVPIADQTCGAETCAADELCCDGACRRTLDDPAHCGGCGQACRPGELCSGAVCRCGGASGCTGVQTCCPGGCFDLDTDPFNCGGCGQACRPGEICVDGACACAHAPGGASCGANEVCCAGSGCVQFCSCAGTLCQEQEICCDDQCTNVTDDNANCGACGKTCTGGLTCSMGSCRCNGGQVCSPGDTCCPSGCAHLDDDPLSCGACGKACAPGEVCRDGTCVCGDTACANGQTCCGNVCVNPKTDPRNCGACGNRCDAPELCMDGKCSCEGGPTCVGNQTCCKAGPTGPAGCYDLSRDPQHCGACDKACAPGQGCEMGSCVAGCTCGNGNECKDGSCTCNGGPACTDKTECCPSGCRNLLNDVENCGACGKSCALDELCCDGACRKQDKANCGACGEACKPSMMCCLCPTIKTRIIGTCSEGLCACPVPL